MQNKSKLQFNSKKIIKFVIVPLSLLGVVSFFMAVFLSISVFYSFKSLQFEKTSKTSLLTKPIVNVYSALFFKKNSFLELWSLSLSAAHQVSVIGPNISKALSPGFELEENKYTQAGLDLSTNLNQIAIILENNSLSSRLVKKLVPQEANFQGNPSQTLQNLSSVLQKTFSQSQTWLVFLQNTDEIRATGGFMGSYALINTDHGLVDTIKFEDIYDADGQFFGFINSPAGQLQYLSSGNGLRLPDANWNVEFSQSANLIEQIMTKSEKGTPTALIAFNLSVAEKMVDLLGPIYLSDYQTQISSQNLADMARKDRDKFFPGDKQKTSFIQSLFNQLKIALVEASPEAQIKVLKLLSASTSVNDIQFYSSQPDLQNIFSSLKLDGQKIDFDQNQMMVYLVESNVGINKANRQIDRQVEITWRNSNLNIQIKFQNNNQPPLEKTFNQYVLKADHLAYANYQRLVIPSSVQVEQILVNDLPIKTWDEEILAASNGKEFKQIGFLVITKEQRASQVKMLLSTPLPINNYHQLLILRQPGLPSTDYTIHLGEKRVELAIDKNTALDL